MQRIARPNEYVENECLVFREAKEFEDNIGFGFLINIANYPNVVNTRLHWMYQLMNNLTILLPYA